MMVKISENLKGAIPGSLLVAMALTTMLGVVLPLSSCQDTSTQTLPDSSNSDGESDADSDGDNDKGDSDGDGDSDDDSGSDSDSDADGDSSSEENDDSDTDADSVDDQGDEDGSRADPATHEDMDENTDDGEESEEDVDEDDSSDNNEDSEDDETGSPSDSTSDSEDDEETDNTDDSDTPSHDDSEDTDDGESDTAQTSDGESDEESDTSQNEETDTGDPPDPSCGSHKWACWVMPNPAGSGLPNPASYTDNGDGTVTDDVTGLMWQKEEDSQSFNFDGANAHCQGLSLGGHDDWRAPTRVELTSIMDFTAGGTKIDGTAFPGAPGGYHWTGSNWILDITGGRGLAWMMNMSDGMISNAYDKNGDATVRCVRGHGAGEGPNDPAVAPPNQYTVISDDEVQDNYTGLIWQRGYTDSMVSWEEAVSYCENLGLGGHTWRLPSIREAATLVDEATVAPSINEEMFPNTQYGSKSNNWYWASHQAQGSSASWAINFDDGFTGFNAGSAGAWNAFGPSWARCVR